MKGCDYNKKREKLLLLSPLAAAKPYCRANVHIIPN